MSKKEPFADIDTTKAIINVAQGQMPTPDEHRLLPKESALWTVIRKCWSFLPDERIAMLAVAQTVRYPCARTVSSWLMDRTGTAGEHCG